MVKTTFALKRDLRERDLLALVDAASKFACVISYQRGASQFDGKSIIAMLAVRPRAGEKFDLVCDGEDESSALKQLSDYLDRV